MDESGSGSDPAVPQRPLADRLDSWKKIAVYLKRDVSTVQRWERREEMPVHRHLHDKQGSVFAYRSELDAWWESRRVRLAWNPVTAPAPDSPESPPPDGLVPARRPRAPARLGRAAAALGLLLLALAVAWFALDRARAWRNPLANAKFSRLSAFPGTEQAAAISPDGRFVAFLASRDGPLDAWVGEIGSGNFRNLTQGRFPGLSNPSIRTLGFSADSSLVSVWTRTGDGTQPQDVTIYAAPTGGGALRPYLENAAEFDWSRDGSQLVYHTTAPGDPLFVQERGASAARQIYAAAAGVHCHYPLWSHDGAFIYFVRGVPPGDWDIWRVRPSGAGLERLTHHDARLTYPVWLDARTLAYLVTEADGSGPWVYGLDVERPVPHRLSAGLETYTSLSASADGMRVIATTANPRRSLWRVAPGTTQAQAPTLLAADGRMPRLGPGFLVFLSTRGGAEGVWTLSGDTTREIWHEARAHVTGAPSISADGRRIAFTVDDGSATRLVAIDRDGANLQVLSAALRLQGNPAWSVDGKSVVSAALYGGEPRLTRIFPDGSAARALLTEYSVDPVWSSDGRFLVYSGSDIGTTFPVRAVAADGRPYAIPSLILTRGARRLAITGDPPALVVLRGDLRHRDLWSVDLKSGAERQLTALPPEFSVDDFDIAADGSQLVLARVEENSEVALIERQPAR